MEDVDSPFPSSRLLSNSTHFSPCADCDGVVRILIGSNEEELLEHEMPNSLRYKNFVGVEEDHRIGVGGVCAANTAEQFDDTSAASSVHLFGDSWCCRAPHGDQSRRWSCCSIVRANEHRGCECARYGLRCTEGALRGCFLGECLMGKMKSSDVMIQLCVCGRAPATKGTDNATSQRACRPALAPHRSR